MPPVIGAVVAIGSAIGSAGAAVGAAIGVSAAVGTTLVVNGILMGAEIGISALTRPSAPKQHTDPITSQINVRQPLTYRRIVYGTNRVAGVMTFIGLSGTNNNDLHVVYTLASHEVGSVGSMYLDGVAVPLTNTGNSGNPDDLVYVPSSGPYVGYVQVTLDLGLASNTTQPFPGLVSAGIGWASTALQRNCAKAHVEFTWDQNVWPNGLPSSVAFDINGKKVYDPRSSTTAFSNNPALVLRDYLTDTKFGLDVDPADIDDSAVSAAANICDESVSLKAGGSQTRYTCDGVIDTSMNHADAIKNIVTSMAGWAVPPGDKWRIYAGAYTSPTVVLTQDDLRGPVKLDTKASRRDIANGITGTYVSSANKWQPSNFPPYQSSTYLTQDGGTPIWKDIQLPFTTDGIRAQRIAKIMLERLRHEQTLTLSCKLSAFQLDPGDTVMFTFDPLGYSEKIFEVVQTNLVAAGGNLPAATGDSVMGGGGSSVSGQNIQLPALGIDLVLKETDSGVYSWTPSTDEGTVTNPSDTTVPSLSSPAAPTGVGAESGASLAIIRQDGLRHDRIHVYWTAPADINVTSGGKINIFYTEHGTGAWRLAGQADGADTEYYIMDVVDGTSYDIKIQSVNTARVCSAFVEVDGLVATGGTTDYVGNLPVAAYGKNMCPNPGFEFNSVGTRGALLSAEGTTVCDGWVIHLNQSGLWQVSNESSNGRNSNADLLLRMPENVTIPNGTFDVQVFGSQKIPLQLGDYVGWRVWQNSARNLAAPAQLTFATFFGLALFTNSGGLVGYYFSQVNPNYAVTWGQTAKAVTVSNSTVAYAIPYLQQRVTNSGSAITTSGSGLYSDVRFDDLFFGVQATTLDIVPANSSNTPTGTNLCTQSGTSTTINTAAFTMQYPFGQVNYNASSVNPGSYGTWYVTMDDPTFSGGAIAPSAWGASWRVTAAEGRIYLGKLTTASGGGGGSGGSGGGGACFSANTLVMSRSGCKPISEFQVGDWVKTRLGWRPVAQVLVHDYNDMMLDMGQGELVTETHSIWHNGAWVPALHTGLWNRAFVHHTGEVYNLIVDTDVEEERNYELANGVQAHNAIK